MSPFQILSDGMFKGCQTVNAAKVFKEGKSICRHTYTCARARALKKHIYVTIMIIHVYTNITHTTYKHTYIFLFGKKIALACLRLLTLVIYNSDYNFILSLPT